MSMLLLVGQVVNVYEAPKGVNKETGEPYGGKPRVQLMAETELQNGDKRFGLIDLTVDDEKLYLSLKGQHVAVPVGAYVFKGSVAFYALKNTKPQRAAAPASSGG